MHYILSYVTLGILPGLLYKPARRVICLLQSHVDFSFAPCSYIIENNKTKLVSVNIEKTSTAKLFIFIYTFEYSLTISLCFYFLKHFPEHWLDSRFVYYIKKTTIMNPPFFYLSISLKFFILINTQDWWDFKQ